MSRLMGMRLEVFRVFQWIGPSSKRGQRTMFVVFGLAMGVSVGVGFVMGGATITAFHGLTHFDALRAKDAPPTLGMYGWLHMLHHRDIPHEVPVAEPTERPSLFSYFAPRWMHEISQSYCRENGRVFLRPYAGPKGLEDVMWAIENLWVHDRWEGIRRLTAYRALVVAGVAVGVTLISGASVGMACATSVVLATGYVAGTVVLMVAYDLEHKWTHVGGPLVSTFHASHHGNQKRNLGMWGRNNWQLYKGHPLLQFTLKEIRRAETLASALRPGLRAAWERAAQEARSAYTAACGR